MRKKFSINDYHYINKIREYNDETKKKWLFISSTIFAIMIIGIWVVYINVTISSVGKTTNIITQKQNVVIKKQTTKDVTKNNSFLETIKLGVYVTFQKTKSIFDNSTSWIKNKFIKIKQSLNKENKVIINGKKEKKYIPQNLNPLPRINLPELKETIN